MNKPKVRITKLDIDWLNIKNLCRATVSMAESKKEPTREWKRKLLITRHSPLRSASIQWRWDNIPYAISTHFARHIHSEKWVSTSREDRTGVPREERSQMDNVGMTMQSNIEALQCMAEKRLCFQADPTTREYMEELKDAIAEHDEDVAWSLAPSGIYKCGCPEKFGKCTYCESILRQMPQEDLFDIEKRLDFYNEYRSKQLAKRR